MSTPFSIVPTLNSYKYYAFALDCVSRGFDYSEYTDHIKLHSIPIERVSQGVYHIITILFNAELAHNIG